MIATREDSQAKLIIFDTLAWTNPGEHYARLISKLETYMTFIVSGQLEAHGGSPDNVVIELLLQHEPPLEATKALYEIKRHVAAKGLELELMMSPTM